MKQVLAERMLVDFGRAGWLEKARQQPDKVRDVLNKARTDGVLPTVEAVRAKLVQPLPLGYSNVGVEQEGGGEVDGVKVGDRVVSNGVVRVPRNLCVGIPDGVSDEHATFTVVGSSALQGVRLAEPTLGESFVVTGLGLIGLLTVQVLRASGCAVLGIDFDRARLDLAEGFGAETVDWSRGEDLVAAAEAFSRGRGVDGVRLTLASQSSEPVSQAAQMYRKRGRIVLAGVTGLELSRADFCEKELTFQVSCSYGPGRYDPSYEEGGQDYPMGFVRWTERRNFEAVLGMMETGTLALAPLVTHRFPFEQATEAYDLLTSGDAALGIVLEYPSDGEGNSAPSSRTVRLKELERRAEPLDAAVSFIGAGNYANRILIPAFRDGGARLRVVSTRGGVGGATAGRKHGFEEATTDTDAVFRDAPTDAVVIATPHQSHARLAVQALEAGKHVFVEKPLAITHDTLAHVEAAYRAASAGERGPLLMVGFNRRFAPLVSRPGPGWRPCQVLRRS